MSSLYIERGEVVKKWGMDFAGIFAGIRLQKSWFFLVFTCFFPQIIPQ